MVLSKQHIKAQVTSVIENSQTDVHELVELLEITVEDILRTYPHRLIEHAEKFGVYPDEGTEDRDGREEEME